MRLDRLYLEGVSFMDKRLIINQPIRPGKKIKQGSQNKRLEKKKAEKSFKEILNRQLDNKKGVKFSKHAQNRIMSRKIDLSEKELKQLKSGINKARDKGARDSLIMVNEVAYVVSVENDTVITAIDGQNVKENVFTNIDSAVFM